MHPSEEDRGKTGFTVKHLLRRSLSENTRIAYETGWRRFAAYCNERRRDPMVATPDEVADFVVGLASEPRSPSATTRKGEPLALGTIRIYLAAISRKYREHDRESPARHSTVAGVLRGLERLSAGPRRRVKALREHEIARILSHCDELARRESFRTIGTRDAAVISVGFAGALRRSEICGLRCGDLEFLGGTRKPWGMFLHIRRSKTDQTGKGQRIAIPDGAQVQPVNRLRKWLALSGITRGPLFQSLRRGGRLQGRALSRSDVPRLVKRYVSAIGLDPSEYSGHSLRVGFVTSAAVHRARIDKIMEVTRHTSAEMVLRYIRQEDAFEDHAGDAFL